MIESEFIAYAAGGVLILLSGALAVARVDREGLRKRRHSMPMYALFRFPVYRWGSVLLLFCSGVFAILLGAKAIGT